MARRRFAGKKPASPNTTLKRGDTVMVIAGGNKKKRPNKGQTGKLVRFVGKDKDRVIVEGVNTFVRHQRQLGPDKPAGKVRVEGGIHLSNVMFYAEKIKKPVRLVYKRLEDGRKVRGYLDGKKKEFVQVDA